MADRLVAWLYGTPVLTLSPAPNRRIVFEWDQRGINRWGLGSRVLSVCLPLGSPTSSRDDRAFEFFSNLLPDGPVLIAMAQLAGVSPLDTFGLLVTFGSECAGAVVLLPDGEVPLDASHWGSTPLSKGELAHLIDALPTTPFGANLEQGWTPSLPGFQGKIVLGRLQDGRWTRPTNGAPSTWILKPDREHRLAENEATCLGLAQLCGLPVPDVELLDVNGTKVLAIHRYDRDEAVSPIARIHQEDGCQASGTAPMQKYEQAGGPSLKDLAHVLRDHGDVNSMRELLRRVAFNVAVGNADAHAKNFSFLHDAHGRSITLAPVYDVLSTITLERRPNAVGIMEGASTTMGQRVDGREDISEVSKDDIINEGVRWGLQRQVSESIVAEVCSALGASIEMARGDEFVLDGISAQLSRLS